MHVSYSLCKCLHTTVSHLVVPLFPVEVVLMIMYKIVTSEACVLLALGWRDLRVFSNTSVSLFLEKM